jgi:predicted lipid-binding transport protein (Tim44 family)
MQSPRMSFYETLAQNIVGQMISYLVLTLFGVEMRTAFGLMATMFVASYIRSYIIRRVFTRIS